MRIQRYFVALLAMSTVLWLAACASVNQQHPEVETLAEAPAANVYFIRPKPLKTKGYADKPVRVDFQGQPLVTLDEGAYTLLRIKPSDGLVKVNSMTTFANQAQPIDVWRERRYKFLPGRTYFIFLKQLNEEFRGIYYEPEPVDWEMAKQLIETARASGAARNAPIEDLTEVVAPPNSTVDKLAPALPENIYKSEQYLRSKQF
jgi:hypothetical protein